MANNSRTQTPRNPADIAAVLARALEPVIAMLLGSPENDDDLLPEQDACRVAGCSKRTLSDARKRGEIPAYGRQRSRAYKRADVMAWIESRKVIHAPTDDKDIEARMRRLAGGK